MNTLRKSLTISFLAISRENKMIETKKEINELLRGIGYAEKYKIH